MTELSGWSVDLDAVVAAGERLVDGVVDDLVDEVVEAARAGRADVHAGPQPDRLEALEDRDVLCGVSGFSHQEKALQIARFAGIIKCIRNGGRQRPVARLAAAARATSSRSSSSSIAAASSARLRDVLGAGLGTGDRPPSAAVRRRLAAAARARSGAPAARLAERVREALERRSAELRELEGPGRRARRDVQRAVARDARRPGVARDLLAHRRRPGARRSSADARRLGPKRRELAAGRSSPSRSITRPRRPGRHLESCAGSSGSASRAGRRDERLPARRGSARASAARRRASSSESTSSSSSSGGDAAALGEQLRLGEQEREHGEPLLALRAEAAQVAVAREQIATSSRCGPSAGRRRARGRARGAPRAPRRSAARPS